jgi:phospholipase/carboxylesterase
MASDLYAHLRTAGSSPAPLVFAFHGTGGDEHQLLDIAGQVLPGAPVVAPRGDVLEHGAARFFRRTGEGVYDMADLAARTRKMAQFVAAEAGGTRPLVGIGYSNGANILAAVLFAEPALFDAAVLMHPLIPFEPQLAGPLAGRQVLITAGRRDPICPPGLTRRLAEALIAGGAKVELEWHDGGHELRPAELTAAHRFLAPLASGIAAKGDR